MTSGASYDIRPNTRAAHGNRPVGGDVAVLLPPSVEHQKVLVYGHSVVPGSGWLAGFRAVTVAALRLPDSVWNSVLFRGRPGHREKKT